MDSARLSRILALALPIIGGMISQNILNLVDTAMVGALGDAALAAVGIGGFASYTAMALILGVSTGVQATASRRKGEGRLTDTAIPLNAGLLLVVIAAPPFSFLLYHAVPLVYPFLHDDPAVITDGVPYLQVRVLAITFVGINFAFRGYWNAVDLSRLYMGTLIVMHASNIALNYVLIFGKLGAPALGVTGAGIGTALSTVIGAATYVALGMRHAKKAGFLHGLPAGVEIRQMIRISLPAGVQQLFFSAGMLATFWIVGMVGTRELAAASVLINVTLVAILPGLGFGLAAATLVGQALGRGDKVDAMRWGWDVVRVGSFVLAALGLPMLLTPDMLLAVFIHDPTTVAVGRVPMRLVGATMAIEAVGLILMNALLGAGDARRVMTVAVSTQWAFFLPLAYVVGPVLGFGLTGIWVAQFVYRAAQAGMFFFFWRRGSWASIRV